MKAEFAVPRVKVCGITRAEDLLAAIAAGATAIGFVEYPASPRAVTRERARELIEVIAGRVPAVAVLVDRDPDFAAAWMRASGATVVQLCGSERPEAWRGFDFPVLRRVGADASAEAEMAAWKGIAAAFVLDHPSAPGGTGLGVDVARAAHLARLAPCLLAGGLDENNVDDRVRAVRPQGVDASSRLEISPGIKDPMRVAAFVRAALGALQEIGS
ncbi:MAG: phosphoribosylanthranilate isomerase [Byssovorax sp.]